MNKKKILSIIMIIAGICACVSGGVMIKNALDSSRVLDADEIVETPAEYNINDLLGESQSESEFGSSAAGEESTGQQDSTEESTALTESSTEPEPEPVENPYAGYYNQNEDMVAWLNIPGMDIDYPVMQTPDNEEYYLRRGFDKKKDSNGCLILDTDSSLDPLGTNLMIHGHNMKSGKMFGTLMNYKDVDFYREHKTITLYTKECRKNYEVMAVFYSQVYKKSDNVFKFYKFFQADTEEEFLDFYDNVMDMAIYDTGVTAQFGDRFLTLVTCSYHVDNGRFVVVAKEVEDGESYLPVE